MTVSDTAVETIEAGPQRPVRVQDPHLAVTFPRVLKSEWIKLRSIRSIVITLLASAVVVVGIGLLAAAVQSGSITPSGGGPRRGQGFGTDPTGTAKVANSLIPPTIADSANSEGYALKFDVAAAKAELAKSKYPKGFTMSLMVASGNSLRAQEAQVIQAALAKIGKETGLRPEDL